MAEALRIADEWPILGIWGGSIIPEFEIEPPGHLRPFLHAVAMVEVKSPRWSNVINCPGATVCGAGMCLRADVAAAYRQFYNASDIRLTDRSGEDLLGGGDVEIGHVACGLGFGIGRFPDLQLTHLIPRHRVAEEYLIRLTEGNETSIHLLNFKWNGDTPRAPYSGIELLRFMKNVIVRRGVDRRMYLARRRAIRRARAIVRKVSNPKHAASNAVLEKGSQLQEGDRSRSSDPMIVQARHQG